MKTFNKVLLGGVVIVGFIAYSLHSRGESNSAVATTKSSGSGAPASPQTSPPATTTSYKDGSYTGSVADAFYGNIQVKATIQGGRITDVQFLQYPNDQPNSIQVNQAAIPVLKQEALQAQSAQVDTVTGATDSSQAFVQSLKSALANAKA